MEIKKIIYLFLFCLFSSFNVNFCYAELTPQQQDKIAEFAKQIITNGNQKYNDNNNLPLLAYDQQNRQIGFNNMLYFLQSDFNNNNTNKQNINSYKWLFDCSSFAAYVYQSVLNLKTTFDLQSQNKPFYAFTVRKFLDDADNNLQFEYIIKNIKISELNDNLQNLQKLQKADLIVLENIKGKYNNNHIMIYLGDGFIAHFSASANSYENNKNNLGAEIILLKDKQKYQNYYAHVLRVKNNVVDKNFVPKTKISFLKNAIYLQNIFNAQQQLTNEFIFIK